MTNGVSRIRRLARAVVPPLLLVGMAGGLAVGLGEITVRLVAPQQLILIRPDIWQPADTVGWLHRPLVNTTINTGERSVRFITDDEGFRIGDPAPPASPAHRVLLVGDSFVEALQVDHDQTVVALLAQRLADSLHVPVRVVNAGVGGWGPTQYRSMVRRMVAQDSFDLVIVSMYLGNDLVVNDREVIPPRRPVERARFHWPGRLAWREIVAAWLAPVNDFLEVRSHLYILFRTQLNTLRMRLGLSPTYFPDSFLKRTAADARWETTAGVAAGIAETAGAHGVPTLFVLVPTEYQVDTRKLEAYLTGFNVPVEEVDIEQPNRRLRDTFDARGLWVVDALAAFRDAQGTGLNLYGTVDPHLSPDGHRAWADLLFPHVLRTLRPAAPVEP